jgi:hypothetical protein
MHSELGRGQREDPPAVAGVHGLEAQDIAQERAGSLGVLRKDDRVRPSDHAGIIVWPGGAHAGDEELVEPADEATASPSHTDDP